MWGLLEQVLVLEQVRVLEEEQVRQAAGPLSVVHFGPPLQLWTVPLSALPKVVQAGSLVLVEQVGLQPVLVVQVVREPVQKQESVPFSLPLQLIGRLAFFFAPHSVTVFLGVDREQVAVVESMVEEAVEEEQVQYFRLPRSHGLPFVRHGQPGGPLLPIQPQQVRPSFSGRACYRQCAA